MKVIEIKINNKDNEVLKEIKTIMIMKNLDIKDVSRITNNKYINVWRYFTGRCINYKKLRNILLILKNHFRLD